MPFFFQLNSSCTLSCSLRLNFARSLLIFCLVRSVSNSEARSLASASPSSFIFTEGDLINKPIFVTADNRLKYRAICCCINRLVLDNISGWCRLLREVVSNFRESGDRSKNSTFFLFAPKDPFGESFSKIIFKSSSEFLFWKKNTKVRNRPKRT